MDDFYWADLHLGHEKIIELSERPFKSIKEMDEYYLDRINSKVGVRDRLFVVGDLANDKIPLYRPRIKCKQVCLMLGNHDKLGINNKIFHITKDIYTYKYEDDYLKQDIVLCHYPFKEWNKMWSGSWSLHGHCHGMVHEPHEFQLDVGVDPFPDGPLSFYEVYEIMKQKRIAWLRHHGPRIKKMMPDWVRPEDMEAAFRFLR